MNGGNLHAGRAAARFTARVSVGNFSPTNSEASIAAATQRLAATLQEMRSELEYTRQLTELARMTGEVRALTAELAATQRAFLEAERAAASQELASLRRAPVEAPTRVVYRPMPARPRGAPATPVAVAVDGRVELAGELVDLRGLVERVAEAAQRDELAARLDRFRQRLQDPDADCEAIRTEIGVVRALLYRALRPKPVSRPVGDEPNGGAASGAASSGAAGTAAATPAGAKAVSRIFGEAVGARGRRAREENSKVQQLRTAVVALAALVMVMLGLLMWNQRRPVVSEAVVSAKSESPVAPGRALPQEAEVRGQAEGAIPQAVAIAPGEFVDDAGRFRCELLPGWEVTAESNEAVSSLRLMSGRDEILVLCRPALAVELDARGRSRLERQLATRINQLTSGEMFAEVVDTRWVPADDLEALQMVLRVAVGAETWRVLAVNYWQHDREHLLVLYVRSEGREAQLQAAFQQFVYGYHSLEPATELAGELPFLRGVVAEAMTKGDGRNR